MTKLNIGLGCSGGTASSMAAVCKFVVNKFSDNYNIWALPECWKLLTGISDEVHYPLTPEIVMDWDKVGGSPFLPSCKNMNIFKVPIGDGQVADYSDKVKSFYDSMNLDCIILVGGGGTIKQAAELTDKYPLIKCIVLLATMDNDVSCFDNSLGFETAVQQNVESIIAGISDAYTMRRNTLVFTMGYDTGAVALQAGLEANKRTGKVDFIYLPESKMNIDDFSNFLKDKTAPFVGVCSEGVCHSTDGANGIHKKFDIKSFCDEVYKKSGVDFKVIVSDYRQRSGVPVEPDLTLAHRYAERAYSLVSNSCFNHVIGGCHATYLSLYHVSKVLKEQDSAWTTWFKFQKPSIVL